MLIPPQDYEGRFFLQYLSRYSHAESRDAGGRYATSKRWLPLRCELAGQSYIAAALVSWQDGVDLVGRDFFARVLLVAVGILAVFRSLRRETRRVKASSRAFLLPGTVLLGSTPARMKPCPAPS